MNIYFLVEGKTEAKIYREWLTYLLPELTRVKFHHQVTEKNYYLFNARGYPHIIDVHLSRAIEDVNSVGDYDYLVLSFDADESTVAEREAEVNQRLTNSGISLGKTKLIIIVQNRCIETWLLGNRKLYKRNPHDPTLVKYTKFYDVSVNDPELMGKYKGFNEHQQFHKAYFKRLCRERHLGYSEKRPNDVLPKSYIEQLLARIDKTTHLTTFRHFIEFCQQLRPKLKSVS
jgi:hypothetical protein